MERRNFLAGTGVMAMTALAGCSGDGGSAELLSVGSSVTSDGLEISVAQYRIASEYTEVYPDYGEDDNQTAPSGAVFVFIEVSVRHGGETEKTLPGPADVNAFYLGEETDRRVTYSDPNYRVDETVYIKYDNALDGAEREGVFPGKEVQGWVIFELPEGFDQTEMVVAIEDDEFSDKGESYLWSLSE